MASTMFMRVDEVAEELGVSVPYEAQCPGDAAERPGRETGNGLSYPL